MAFVLLPVDVLAEAPVIEAAQLTRDGDGFAISVTIRHPDTGWDHYADGWQVLDAEGNELGYRKLLHPHETEQPFTRSLGGIDIPDGVTQVFLRAHCSTDGWADEMLAVEVPR